MVVNRDPNGKSLVTEAMIRASQTMNLKIINIICRESGGEKNCISFFALVSDIPRKGESIILENGKRCEVKNVYHQVSNQLDEEGNAIIMLVSNISTVVVKNRNTDN